MSKKLVVLHFQGKSSINALKRQLEKENYVKTDSKNMWVIERNSFLGWIFAQLIRFRSWKQREMK